MLARSAALLLCRSVQQGACGGAARTLATAASSAVEIKLPVAPLKLSGTSGAIATLAWQVSQKSGNLDKVQDELRQMVEVFRTEPQMMRLATDPFVPALIRKKIVENVLKDSGATEITKRLFEALADENCLAATLKVSEAFDELMLAHKKEVYCTIITAQPLDKMEKVDLRKQAEKFVEPGFQLVMKEKVDKKILGGFVLEFEDRRVDMSTSKKLDEFSNLVAKLENDLK